MITPPSIVTVEAAKVGRREERRTVVKRWRSIIFTM